MLVTILTYCIINTVFLVYALKKISDLQSLISTLIFQLRDLETFKFKI